MTKGELLEYLTPTTLEEMYRDLDETRLTLIDEISRDNNLVAGSFNKYHELTELVQEIDQQYQNLTGEILWVKVVDNA